MNTAHPRALTLLSWLLLVLSALGLTGGMFMVVYGQRTEMGSQMGQIMKVFFLPVAFFSAVGFVAAVGLFQRRRWARTLTLALSAAGTVIGTVLVLVYTLNAPEWFLKAPPVFVLAGCGWAFFLLRRKDIKKNFR